MYRVTISWLYENHADVESAHIFRSTVHNSEKEFQEALNNNDFTDLTLVKSYDDLTQLSDNSIQTHTDTSVAKNTTYFYAVTAKSMYGKYRLGVYPGVDPSDTELTSSDQPENSSVYGVTIPDFADVHTTLPVFNISSERVDESVADSDVTYIKTELQSAMDWWSSAVTIPSNATSLMDNGKISIELVIEDLGASAAPATSQILEYVGLDEFGDVDWGTTFTKRARVTFNSYFVAESKTRHTADPSKTTLMYALARHELFHLLGMGSTLFNAPNAPLSGNTDEGGAAKYFFVGENAISAYENSLDASFAGQILGIPLEDNGGAGTENMHFEAGEAYVDLDSLVRTEEAQDNPESTAVSDNYGIATNLINTVSDYQRSSNDLTNMIFKSDYSPANSSFFSQLDFFGAYVTLYGYGDFTTTGAAKDYSVYLNKYNNEYLSRANGSTSSDEILKNYIIYELTNNWETKYPGLPLPESSGDWSDSSSSRYVNIMDQLAYNKRGFKRTNGYGHDYSDISLKRAKSIASSVYSGEGTFWGHGLTWGNDENIAKLAIIIFNLVVERIEPPLDTPFLYYEETRRHKHWAAGVLIYNLFQDTSAGLESIAFIKSFGGKEADDQLRFEENHTTHKQILKNVLNNPRASLSLS